MICLWQKGFVVWKIIQNPQDQKKKIEPLQLRYVNNTPFWSDLTLVKIKQVRRNQALQELFKCLVSFLCLYSQYTVAWSFISPIFSNPCTPLPYSPKLVFLSPQILIMLSFLLYSYFFSSKFLYHFLFSLSLCFLSPSSSNFSLLQFPSLSFPSYKSFSLFFFFSLYQILFTISSSPSTPPPFFHFHDFVFLR